MRLGVLAVFLLSLCAACTPTLHGPKAPRLAVDTLDETSARLRAMQLSDVRYELAMLLDADSPEYRGEVSIRFMFTTFGAPLSIDFGGGTVQAMSINGGPFGAADYNGFSFRSPPLRCAQGPTKSASVTATRGARKPQGCSASPTPRTAAPMPTASSNPMRRIARSRASTNRISRQAMRSALRYRHPGR